MRQQVAGNHSEKCAWMVFVKIVNLRLDVIDVLAAFEYYFGTQAQAGHLIDDPGQQA